MTIGELYSSLLHSALLAADHLARAVRPLRVSAIRSHTRPGHVPTRSQWTRETRRDKTRCGLTVDGPSLTRVTWPSWWPWWLCGPPGRSPASSSPPASHSDTPRSCSKGSRGGIIKHEKLIALRRPCWCLSTLTSLKSLSVRKLLSFWLHLVTFPYLSLPFLSIPFLSIPFLTFPCHFLHLRTNWLTN